MSLRSGGSTLRCGRSRPRPRTQDSHQGAYGRCVSSWSSRSATEGASGPASTIGWRAPSGSLLRSSSLRCFWASTLRWYSTSASLSWSRSQSCALVPQMGALSCLSLALRSPTLLSAVRWPGDESTGSGRAVILWNTVTTQSPTSRIRLEGSSRWRHSTRSSHLTHWPSRLIQVVRSLWRENLGAGVWNTVLPRLTRTGSPSCVFSHPVFALNRSISAAGSSSASGGSTATGSAAWGSSASASSWPTTQIQPNCSSWRTAASSRDLADLPFPLDFALPLPFGLGWPLPLSACSFKAAFLARCL